MIRYREQVVLFATVVITLLTVMSACAGRPQARSTPTRAGDLCQERMPTNTVDSPAVIALPEYLGRVWPAPGSTVHVQEYRESLDRSSILSGNVGVGVELLAHNIAEEGDIDINWIARSSILVDSIPPPDDVGLFSDGAVLHEAYREVNGQKQLLYRVGGPYYLAWRVPLDQGKHSITFRVLMTSDVIFEYSWEFSIIP